MTTSSVATILIADYDIRSRRSCEQRLAESGFTVVAATDGREALEAALRSRPDIICASLYLPTIGGIALCHRLKRDRRTSHIRFILHSNAALLPLQRRQVRDAACDVLLIQPDMPDDVLNAAGQLFGDRTLEAGSDDMLTGSSR